ncbi:hypothetical protein DERF_014265 [Dermatophagoides farinae]|uniref:Uncharacterized protein n=1 Tax=Dermatophagoides farinae TaxID=6954 RepID=A0A922HHN7_DERFA|nr:hypothetical protein DERF_014265 [Dermatophagoides farinae]
MNHFDPNITVAYSWRPSPSSKSGGLKTNLVHVFHCSLWTDNAIVFLGVGFINITVGSMLHMDGNLKILKIQRGRMYDEPKMKKIVNQQQQNRY